MFDTSGIGVFLGLDVGRGDHHAHGLTPAGKTVHDKRLPNSEPKLRALFDKLREKFGTVLVIVDQIATIGALPVAVARDAGRHPQGRAPPFGPWQGEPGRSAVVSALREER